VHHVGFIKKNTASSDESVKRVLWPVSVRGQLTSRLSFLQLNPKAPNNAHKPPPAPLTNHLSPFLLEILLNMLLKFSI